MSINKIKKTKDFSLIYNKSKKMHTKYAIIFIKENINNEQRFGFVASKKTGNAVQRNRIKRIFKEFVKTHKDKFKKNTDYIFVGKSILKENIKTLKYKDIEKDISKVIK
ncbi:ribonuclease P protein component [Leptotrichia trevisanii]|jgi:ribonuclease P protein component|uniref:Ribonuclease P protein component n=1 Tax=Leptotrichia trevisanii TaxID=109328 RepID=A0A510K7U8_9FUSO|nr:ribonuclease P protein component [Leptotrichia trevisanii]BBM46495.1 ribonuclease P protein component [Leptotrichia trevisanii]BBM53736.1 ribonuclease P protein component [Leptotrichia trevisanii]BBM58437.1 ribonuclease P protein component [Leptotrichia trevisanii]